MLECELAQQEEMKVKYLSELGLLSVHYSCRYYVEWEKRYRIQQYTIQTPQGAAWSLRKDVLEGFFDFGIFLKRGVIL